MSITETTISCFECGQPTLATGIVRLDGERQGEIFTVETEGLQCMHTNCGFKTVDSRQSDQFTALLSDAFRKKHGLLTGTEIREIRRQLGMTQPEFAEYLGVGVASVKRWELGRIQEKAMDELIRLKTDRGAALRNLQAIERG